MLFKYRTYIFGKYEKHLKFNQKEESNNYMSFATSISNYSPIVQKSRIHREITVLSICSFIFCWIRIHADPDPQHCWIEQNFWGPISVFCHDRNFIRALLKLSTSRSLFYLTCQKSSRVCVCVCVLPSVCSVVLRSHLCKYTHATPPALPTPSPVIL